MAVRSWHSDHRHEYQFTFQGITGRRTVALSPSVPYSSADARIFWPGYLYAFAIGDPVRGGLVMAAWGWDDADTDCHGTMVGSLSAGREDTLHRLLGTALVELVSSSLSHGLMLLCVPVPTCRGRSTSRMPDQPPGSRPVRWMYCLIKYRSRSDLRLLLGLLLPGYDTLAVLVGPIRELAFWYFGVDWRR